MRYCSFSGYFGRIKRASVSSLHGNFMPSQRDHFLGSLLQIKSSPKPLMARWAIKRLTEKNLESRGKEG